jgi:hypothetical protein
MDAMFKVAERQKDLADGLAGSEDAFYAQLEAYDELRKRAGLLNAEWVVSSKYSKENAKRLSMLTEEVIKHARGMEKTIAVEKEVVTQKERLAKAQEQVKQKLGESDAAQKAYIETLREKYELQSKDEMVANLQQSVKEYNALKDAGQDMNELSEAFSQQLVDQVELAKQNKIELPAGVREMAAELKEKADPALQKVLDKIASELPKHVNAMPGKVIPGMVKVGDAIATTLSNGFETAFNHGAMKSDIMRSALAGSVEKGIDEGISLGEELFAGLRTRQEAEVLTVPVRGDWSEFDQQAQYRSAGYTPETGAP